VVTAPSRPRSQGRSSPRQGRSRTVSVLAAFAAGADTGVWLPGRRLQGRHVARQPNPRRALQTGPNVWVSQGSGHLLRSAGVRPVRRPSGGRRQGHRRSRACGAGGCTGPGRSRTACRNGPVRQPPPAFPSRCDCRSPRPGWSLPCPRLPLPSSRHPQSAGSREGAGSRGRANRARVAPASSNAVAELGHGHSLRIRGELADEQGWPACWAASPTPGDVTPIVAIREPGAPDATAMPLGRCLSSLASRGTSRVRCQAPRPQAGRTRPVRHATHSTPGSARSSRRCCATGTTCRRRPAVLAQTIRRGCPGCSGRTSVHQRQLDRGRGRGRRDARAAPGLQTRAWH